MPRGCRQAYRLKRLISSPTPKPASSPTLCSACVGKMGDDPIAIWKSKSKWYSEKNNHLLQRYESNWRNTDGVRVENIPLGFLEKIQKLIADLQCEPEHFKDMIIFMSMYNDIVWHAKGNQEQCEYNSKTDSCGLCSQIPSRSLVFLGSWIRRKVVRNLHLQTRSILGSKGRRNVGKFLSIRSSDISCLQCFWERRVAKQRRGKMSIHFNGSNDTIELLLRTVISANQLSVYGAIADLCNEVPKDLKASGKLAALDH